MIQSLHMGNFNRGGGSRFGSGRPSFGKRRFGGDRSERPTMHKATCSKCGNECEVPFQPTGSKPVFCSACFEGEGGGRKFESKRFGRPNYDKPAGKSYDDQFASLNAKLDKILKILEPVEI